MSDGSKYCGEWREIFVKGGGKKFQCLLLSFRFPKFNKSFQREWTKCIVGFFAYMQRGGYKVNCDVNINWFYTNLFKW